MMNFLCSLTILASFCTSPQLGALSILKPSQGGTGIGSATVGDVGKVLKVSDDSPFTFELANDETGAGGGSAAVATSTGETAGNLAYWTSTNATPATLGKVATSSITYNSPLTTSGTAGFIVGGSGFTVDIDDIQAADLDLTDITLADFTNDTNFITLGSLSATWPITYNSGTGAFTWSGLATTSNPTAGQLLYSNGSTGLIPVATTTLTASSPLALSNPVFKIGGSDSVLTLDTSGTWSGNAGTATSLAANGTNCSAGSYALGVDASGNAEGCTDATTEIDSAISTHASNATAHQALVTLAGSLDYITLSGQQITRNAIDLATDVTGTLPYTNGGTGTSTAGVLGDVLSWNGSNWQGTATSSLNISASAAGSDTQVQFNDGGTALGGDAGLTYNKTTDTLTLTNSDPNTVTINAAGVDVSSSFYIATGGTDQPFFSLNVDTLTFGFDAAGSAVMDLYGASNGGGIEIKPFGSGFSITNNNDFSAIATTSLLTADRTFTFPNESGSFLLSPFTTGLASNAVPYGDGDNTIATSSNLTFNGTTLTANTLALTNALTVANGGTGNSTFTSSRLLYGNGTNALSGVATTTLTLPSAAPFNPSGTLGALVGGTNFTLGYYGIATSSAIANTEVIYGTAVNQIDSEAAFSYNASADRLTVTHASTTASSMTNLNVSGISVLPSGTAPTVSSAGAIANDTSTINGLTQLVYGASANVLQPMSWAVAGHATSTWTATTTQYLAPAPAAITVTTARCETSTGTVGISLYDGTNRANFFTASTTIGTITFSTNNTFTLGESMRVDFGTPASSPTQVACRFGYTYTRQ